MTILDRYILREYCKWFLLTMISFTLLYLIVDFFGKIRMFLSNDATIFQMGGHVLYGIPQIISHTMPVSVLLASLLAFSFFSKNSEVVAMKSCGISLYRVSLPLLICALVISAFAFLFNEFITPAANQKVKYIENVEIKKQRNLGVFKQNQIWHRSKDAIYNFSLFDPHTNTLKGITVNYFDREFRLAMRIDAKTAKWENNQWVCSDILITKFSQGDFPVLERISRKIIDIPETPSDLKTVQKDTNQMGFLELRKYIEKLRTEGFDPSSYLADMHGKIAFVMVNIVLTIIGISFSLKSERSGGVAMSIGAGIVIGFSYWIVFAFCLSIGRSLIIPPLLAAWSANLILGILGLIMYLRVKT